MQPREEGLYQLNSNTQVAGVAVARLRGPPLASFPVLVLQIRLAVRPPLGQLCHHKREPLSTLMPPQIRTSRLLAKNLRSDSRRGASLQAREIIGLATSI